MNGLAPHTAAIIEQISKLECIKPYVLVGGTALSLQINHRLSEDLDFMRWATRVNEKMEVDWPTVKKEMGTIGTVKDFDLMDLDYIKFSLEDVKLSFYACNKFTPVKETIPYLNNIVLADVDSIAVMKMEVLLRRSNFRDYYDLYSILKDKTPDQFKSLVSRALSYSNHRLHRKSLFSMLSNSNRYKIDSGFKALSPIYDINPQDIEKFMKNIISSAFSTNQLER